MHVKRTGFTIVELLIVIVVVAILATISAVAYNGISDQARDTAKLVEVNQFIKQLELYKMEHREYPTVSPSGSLFATDTLRRDFVAHVNPEPDNYRQKRELFESTYDIAIPEGVLYYKKTYNPAAPRELDAAYVMATFYNNNNIPEANRSNRLKAGAQNGAWPQLVLYAENPCALPVNKLLANIPQSNSGLGASWGRLYDAAKRPTDNGMNYTSSARESAVTYTSTTFYTVSGHEDCGRVTYLDDWTGWGDTHNRNTRKSGVGLFVLKQGSR